MDHAPKLIPRVIHQTYQSGSIPPSVQPLMQSWRTLNPDWDIRFYDDKACLDFVSQEFPEYYTAYKALPKNVERSDFFRYSPLHCPSMGAASLLVTACVCYTCARFSSGSASKRSTFCPCKPRAEVCKPAGVWHACQLVLNARVAMATKP